MVNVFASAGPSVLVVGPEREQLTRPPASACRRGSPLPAAVIRERQHAAGSIPVSVSVVAVFREPVLRRHVNFPSCADPST